jgi:hypothetical protein
VAGTVISGAKTSRRRVEENTSLDMYPPQLPDPRAGVSLQVHNTVSAEQVEAKMRRASMR